MKSIAILGSTGSIGRQTLNVVESLPGRFRVCALAAGGNIELLAEQAIRHRPDMVSVATDAGARELRERLAAGPASTFAHSQATGSASGSANIHANDGGPPEIVVGAEGITAVATHPQAEILVSAAVGVVGLPATHKAIEHGKTIALANKEVLVAAGELVMAAVKRHNVALLPVDSEHNAIHQCLRGGERGEVRRLILTASGGPFRKTPAGKLKDVTPEQALAHPNWRMGQRISIDSATLMNKGFEVIEARWLFDIPLAKVDVVIHPQSTIHSMVEFVDGSILAQLGPTDMRMPIQYALTYPERLASNEHALDWARLRKLEFARVPAQKFPCLRLARQALAAGGSAPCALNAADEIAVAAFLERKIPFLAIARVIEAVLEKMPATAWDNIEDVLAADGEARRLASEEIRNMAA